MIAETLRHVLVPTVYEPPEEFYGSITDTRLDTAEHRELVYSTSTLVTTVVPNKYGSLVGLSSSTTPDLTVRMPETLDVREGQRIREIGTGTGTPSIRRPAAHRGPVRRCGRVMLRGGPHPRGRRDPDRA